MMNNCMTVMCCSLFGHTEEEYIPDAESVYLHREQHHQPQACTLAQCFQLYTKEEQVTHWLLVTLDQGSGTFLTGRAIKAKYF